MKINQWTADKDVNMKGFFTVMNTRIKSSGVCSVQHRQYHLRFWNLTPSYLGFEPPSASFKLIVEPFLNLHVHTSTLSQDSSDEEIATLSMMNNSRRPLLPNCAILDIYYYVNVCSDHVHDPANQVLRSILQQRRAKVVPNLPLPGGGRGNGRGSLTGKWPCNSQPISKWKKRDYLEFSLWAFFSFASIGWANLKRTVQIKPPVAQACKMSKCVFVA